MYDFIIYKYIINKTSKLSNKDRTNIINSRCPVKRVLNLNYESHNKRLMLAKENIDQLKFCLQISNKVVLNSNGYSFNDQSD